MNAPGDGGRPIDEPDAPVRSDDFESAGRRFAAMLRAVGAEADRTREAATVDAQAIRADALARATELHAEAEADRAEAKQLLLRAQERAEQLVLDTGQRIAEAIQDAEQQARTRVGAVLDAGRQRLALLAQEEQAARRRLVEAQADLQEVIDRIAEQQPIIDLTIPEPTVRFGLASAPAVVGSSPGEPRRRRKSDRVPTTGTESDAVSVTDSLTTMVRGAVDRALDTAVEHDRGPTSHPHLSALPDPDVMDPGSHESR
jgi:hypothetical protein